MEPDPSSSVPIPTLPSHLFTLVSSLLGLAGQDSRSTELLVSPGPSGSPYIESPPRRSRSKDQAGHVPPGSLSPFKMLDSNFPAVEGASLAPRNSGPLQVRTNTRAQHVAAASLGSRISSIKCVVESTLQYTMPKIPLQVQDPSPLSSAFWPLDPQESIIPALLNLAVNLQIENQRSVLPVREL